LRQRLASLQLNDLRDTTTSQPAWGIEFRVVQYGKLKLVPLINFNQQTKTVSLSGGGKQQALDLLSGETAELDAIAADTMVPRLLLIGK
jgi:hypothetical protein